MAFRELPVMDRTVVIYRPGDFVASQMDALPVMLEIIGLEDNDRLRVRGLDWPPGYSAVLRRDQVQRVTSAMASV